MKNLFIALFAAAAASHLVSIFAVNDRVQKITKICLLPLLLAVYMSSAKNLFAAVLLAIIFDWGGDALLLRSEDKRFFRLGLVSFLLGHLCYILTLFRFTGTFNVTALMGSAAAASVFGLLVLHLIKPVKDMRTPVIVYMIIIELMSLGSLQFLLYRKDMMGAAVFGGSLCFLLSDTVLAYYLFRRFPKYGNALVMLPYILAQTGIVWGLAAI
ncbi:MAG: lysoplasmalogenase [Treponema sp.]|jgi:uncharacterized membrane protein YhhN|nr:lysoplasmalogenase [Treponema sp.]